MFNSFTRVIPIQLVDVDHWSQEQLETRLRPTEAPNRHIITYSTDAENNHRNLYAMNHIENVLTGDYETLGICPHSHISKRIMGSRMEPRNAPVPAEPAAGRWEYDARENRAFYPQEQEPDSRLLDSEPVVDPLDDMVRQLRVYEKLQEIREALRRSDEFLAYPVDKAKRGVPDEHKGRTKHLLRDHERCRVSEAVCCTWQEKCADEFLGI